MEFVFLLATIIVLIFGILLLIAPKYLLRVSEMLNRVVAIDATIISRRLVFGVIILIAGLYMLYVYINL